MTPDGDAGDPQREALQRVAVVLRRAEMPFALAGGYAAYARGGPEPEHDVDFVLEHTAVEQAVVALTEAGLEVERPAEDWLFKVWWRAGGRAAMVDVIHEVAGIPVDQATIERATLLDVVAVQMPVLSATDLMISKMRALTEHYCDLGRLLPAARALREQVDWAVVAEQTAGNDFAAAFRFLLHRLGVAPDALADQAAASPPAG